MKKIITISTLSLAMFLTVVPCRADSVVPEYVHYENVQHVKSFARNAPGGTITGVGTVRLEGIGLSQAQLIAHIRAVTDISSQLQSFGLDVINDGIISDITYYSRTSPNDSISFQQARFVEVFMASSIIEDGYSNGYYRIVARLTGDNAYTIVPAEIPTDSYVPDFVINARRNPPENTLVGVGVARMATMDSSRAVAQLRAMLDISHQMESLIRYLSTDASTGSDTFSEQVMDSKTSAGILEEVVHSKYVLEEGMATNGDYWVVVYLGGNLDTISNHPIIPARRTRHENNLHAFIENARIQQSSNVLIGIGTGKMATISMSRIEARTIAMVEISTQIEVDVRHNMSRSHDYQGGITLSENVFRSLSSQSLQGALIVDEDFINGEYVVVVRLPRSAVINR